MAIIKKGVLGEISGRIGDKIYRVRDGKNIVCKRPASQKISKTLKSIKNRSKFANTIHFAKLINSTPELSACWKSANIKARNNFQKIISNNNKLTSDIGVTLQNIITPPGIVACENSIKISKSNIIIHSTLEKEIPNCAFKLVALLCLQNENECELLMFKSDNVSLREGNALEGIISFIPDEIKIITSYNKAFLLSAFVNSSPELFWSTTIPFEIVNRDQ